jgi:predicted transglutaminase-like cysteine proteinase
MQMDRAIVARCRKEPETCTSSAAQKFIAIVKEGDRHEGLSRIGRINRAVNFSIERLDTTNPAAVRTRWTSPLDTLSAGVGDCKQYSVLKYAALADAGFAPDDVQIIVLTINSMRQSHAVVAVRHAGRWYILDNRSLAVVESVELRNYLPLFALDRRGVRQFRPPPSPVVAGLPCNRIVG